MTMNAYLPISANALPPDVEAINFDHPLKKHTATIHIGANLTAQEHGLLNVLYEKALQSTDHEWQSNTFHVRMSDIRQFFDKEDKKLSRENLKKNLGKLRTEAISWNIFGQDHKNKDRWDELSYHEVGFISSFDVYPNYVCFSIDPKIAFLIKNPNIYTHIDLRIQKKLTTKYEIILYELLSDELNRAMSDEMITRWYNIGELRRIFSIPLDSYLNDKRKFNKICLYDPIKEINEHTDIDIALHEKEKNQNSVIALRFSVKRKPGMETQQQKLNLVVDTKEELEPISLTGNETNYMILDELTEFFGQKTGRIIYEDTEFKFANAGDFERVIRDNIEYAKRQKNVNSLCAYMRNAILDDWAGSIANQKKEKEELQKKEEQKKIIKAREDEERAREKTAQEQYELEVKCFRLLDEVEVNELLEEHIKTCPWLGKKERYNEEKKELHLSGLAWEKYYKKSAYYIKEFYKRPQEEQDVIYKILKSHYMDYFESYPKWTRLLYVAKCSYPHTIDVFRHLIQMNIIILAQIERREHPSWEYSETATIISNIEEYNPMRKDWNTYIKNYEYTPKF